MEKFEPEVTAALNELTNALAENEIVKDYRKIALKVANNSRLQELEEKIKAAQQEAVQFAHYGKPEAEKAALARLSREADLSERSVAFYNRKYFSRSKSNSREFSRSS